MGMGNTEGVNNATLQQGFSIVFFTFIFPNLQSRLYQSETNEKQYKQSLGQAPRLKK